MKVGDLVTWNSGWYDRYDDMIGIIIDKRLVDREFEDKAKRWFQNKTTSPLSKRYGYDVYWLLLPTNVEEERLEFKNISTFQLEPWNGEYKETLSQNKQTRLFIKEVLDG